MRLKNIKLLYLTVQIFKLLMQLDQLHDLLSGLLSEVILVEQDDHELASKVRQPDL